MKNDDIVKNDAKSLVDFLKASKDDKGIMADIRASASETLVFRACHIWLNSGELVPQKLLP